MLKKLVIFLCCAATMHVVAQVVNNVRLIDFQAYYTRLINEMMNEMERREWCNLKLLDHSQNIDLTIYGWNVNGTVTYTNGFLHAFYEMDLQESTVQQIWSHDSTNEVNRVSLNGNLRLHEMALAYDVIVELHGEPPQQYTGIYTYETVQFSTSLTKVIETGELSASAHLTSLPGANTRHIIYMPETNVSQVLQRQFLPSGSWDGVSGWATAHFAPTMLDLATNVLPYPTLCYNCNA